jgi:hypothetical protein
LPTEVQELNGETELSHLTTVPLFPERVSKPLVLPLQTVVPPVTLPGYVVGSTVTIVAAEFATKQLPLWTTALNWVVCVNAPEVYIVRPAVEGMVVTVLKPSVELCHSSTFPV